MGEEDPSAAKRELMAKFDLGSEVGTAGLGRSGGFIQEEFLANLRDERGRRIYNEMRLNDPTIAGLLFAIEMPVRESRWAIVTDGETPVDEQAREFVESCMGDMSISWTDFIQQVLTMMVYGWSYFEKVFKHRNGRDADPPSEYDDGKVGWRKFAERSQDSLHRWEIDRTGGTQGMWQRDPAGHGGSAVLIPIQKSLLFRTRNEKGNPEGRSILRPAYRPWYFKKNLEQLEGIALERTGAGYPVIYLPEGFDADDIAKAQSMVRRVRLDDQAGMTLPGPKQSDAHPEGWLFEMVQGNAAGVGRGFDLAIRRYRTEILMSVVATFVQLGTERVGSYALSRDHRDFFQIALEGWVRNIEDVLNRFAVPQLVKLNGFAVTEMPRFEHSDIGQHDLTVLGRFVQMLSAAGLLTPDADLEVWLREAAGMPELSEESVGRPAAPTPPAQDTGPTDEEVVEQARDLVRHLETTKAVGLEELDQAQAIVDALEDYIARHPPGADAEDLEWAGAVASNMEGAE